MAQNETGTPSGEELSHKKNLERIKQFRLLDDTFFKVCFEGDKECTEFILRILLDKEDLEVIESGTQYELKNLHGHSVILDVLASDSLGAKYNIEIQRADKGASFKRARYNSSLIDAWSLPAGEDYELLPESYVIFITENDMIGKGKPIYHIEKIIIETGDRVNDGAHTVYVNAAHSDDSPLGKLMHDFRCTNPNDMNYSILAKKARHFKEDTKGVKHMCRIMEEIKAEGRAEGFAQGIAEGENKGRAEGFAQGIAEGENKGRVETSITNAIRMLKDGLNIEKISEYTDLSVEKVEELAALVAG